MIYVLDASVLIAASSSYYPIQHLRRFWSWLLRMGSSGAVKVPREVYNEIIERDDNLSAWLQEPLHFKQLVWDRPADGGTLTEVLGRCYAHEWPVSKSTKKNSADPTLIATALNLTRNKRPATVVSQEAPVKNPVVGPKMKIPDACKILGIPHEEEFTVYFDELKLRINN